jgi:hypothetical protein
MTNITSPDLIKAKTLIDMLDVTPIVERLINIEKWKKRHAIKACEQYKKFLYLKKKYGDRYELPPSLDVDEAWHAHILHSQDYYQFCREVYGSFLHHHPHHGKHNGITKQQLEDMFENQTQRFYYEENGEYLTAIRPLSFKTKLLRLLKKLGKS